MPFKKVGDNDYVSPSGRHFNKAQVGLWYHLGGKFPGQKHAEGTMKYAKGGTVGAASYAAGGPVLGRTRQFLKEPDEFRNPDERNAAADEDQIYGKTGSGSKLNKRTGDKSLKAVKPRG